MPRDPLIDKLLEWYRVLARRFLENVEPEKVSGFDQEAMRLAKSEDQRLQEMTICFLGTSGVGKSTLINALVAGKEVILPAGGIGPLTAQALIVRYSETPRFEVMYHSAGKLWKMIFGLNQLFKEELTGAALISTQDAEVQSLFREGELEEIAELGTETGDGSRKEAYKKAAQLMITGGQNNDRSIQYLIDSLHEVLTKPRVLRTTVDSNDTPRIERLRKALELARRKAGYRRAGSVDDREFLSDLEDHASGFLAPLIDRIEVFWNSDTLASGLTLVDLPGLGIEGDVYRELTREWIRDKAQAVIWVVDHRGLPESGAEVLRTSEYLNRLLYSSDDALNDPELIIVAVRVDEYADNEFYKNRSRKKSEYLQEGCDRSIELVRSQIKSQLDKVWGTSSESSNERRKEIVERVTSKLQVHAVSAIQFRRFLAADEEDPPFIKASEQSNIPSLRDALVRIATDKRENKSRRVRQARDDFFQRLAAAVKLIQAQWQSEQRSAEEADRLRIQLEEVVEPLRDEFKTRKAHYGAFLKSEIPNRIVDLIDKAKLEAEKDIARYLFELRGAHWATLRAAVRREGTFYGARHINLPQDFALRFEEPVADVWNKQILKAIRSRTKQFGDDCLEMVEQVVLWAKREGALIQAKVIEANQESIRADAKNLESVGKEMVNELRDNVKNHLIKVIEDPIRKKCREFVRRGSDIGPGVRDRILELFRQLASEVTLVASKPAGDVLRENYDSVYLEIRGVLKNYDDPLLAATESIVESHEARLKRSDNRKRKGILDGVEEVMNGCPIEFREGESARGADA